MAKKDLREFDPERMAAYDAKMWRVYYDHQFGRLLVLLMRLIQLQFGLSHIRSLRVAYYGALAAGDFRRNIGRENLERVTRSLAKMFRIVSDHALQPFDYRKAAELELEWWMVHRYPKRYSITLGEAVANAMAAIYDMPSAPFTHYGNARAEAMELRDVAADVDKREPDWKKIESILVDSYTLLHEAVQ
jgi:hypothetical protein